MVNIKKVKETAIRMNQEGEDKLKLVVDTYMRLSKGTKKKIPKNQMIAWMIRDRYDGGCGFAGRIDAELYIEYLEQNKGFVFHFEQA